MRHNKRNDATDAKRGSAKRSRRDSRLKKKAKKG